MKELINKIQAVIRELLSDHNDNLSSMRVILFIGAIPMIVLGIPLYFYLSWKAQKFIDIPYGYILYLGLLITGKVAQKFSE